MTFPDVQKKKVVGLARPEAACQARSRVKGLRMAFLRIKPKASQTMQYGWLGCFFFFATGLR